MLAFRKEHIENKRIIITGGASGIGKATAFGLAKKGAKLVLASRDIDKLNQLQGELKQTFPDMPYALTIKCDVTSEADIKNLIDTTLSELGGIDMLINNAGVGVYGEATGTTSDNLHHTMEVNYFGPANCIFEVLPHMIKTHNGIIVNICSVAAIYGIPYMCAYCSSKAALASLGQTLRSELMGKGIHIINIYPGYTQTEFFTHEILTGGARRPFGPYTRADFVANKIIRAIEFRTPELIIPIYGKALSVLKGVMPSLVRKTLYIISKKLKTEIK